MDSCIIMNVYKKGKYYCPANSHYCKDGPVGCDMCGECDICVCIGWCEYDICMTCMCALEKEFCDYYCDKCDCYWSCCPCCDKVEDCNSCDCCD